MHAVIAQRTARSWQLKWQQAILPYFIAGIAVLLMSGVIALVHADASIANIPMLYMLVVIGLALSLGSRPAVFGSFFAFLAFDWFFVDPRYQLSVHDPAEWIALCTFLFSAIVTGKLTATLHSTVEDNRRHNLQTEVLALISWTIASELDHHRCLKKILEQASTVVQMDEAAIYAIQSNSSDPILLAALATSPIDASINLDRITQSALRFVLAQRQAIGWDGSALWSKALAPAEAKGIVYLPIIMEADVLGVLYLRLKEFPISLSTRRVVDSLVNHAAVVLQRDRLLRAEADSRALKEADRLKTALLSMVSHDFRSPLTSIKASVGGLLEKGVPFDAETQTGLLQAIEAETDRLNRMVGNILDLSRLEGGAWKPRCEMTSIAELIGSALDSFDDRANSRISLTLLPDLPEVWADSVQIVQVLRNLLENALKYSGSDGQVELHVRTDGSYALFEIKDRGPGLPKGLENRIFEPFFRAPELQESSVPGIGVGLAVCQGLVEAHKGHLTARNRGGGGAVFRVTLPTGDFN